MTRIQRVTASGFRGISSTLTLDFLGPDKKSQSILALGDNGSGKSSFADALEFCLRGKVSRRGNAGVKTRREARNLLMPGRAPSVKVTLDNGKTFVRGKSRKGMTGISLGRNEFVPGFGLCPVVISRDDIEVFWHLSPSDRLRFFFDYLRDSIDHPGYAALEVERAETRLELLRFEILKAQIALSGVTSWPVTKIPVSQPSFDRWLKRAYPNYLTSSLSEEGAVSPGVQRRRRRMAPRIHNTISTLSTAIESERKLSRHISAMRARASTADGTPAILARDLPELLGDISASVTSDFLTMAKLDHIADISISAHGRDQSLDIECILASGTRAEPTQVLSEGALDLLAILLLFGVAQACAERGQSRFLVLDDVWQSVDAVHRIPTLDYLFSGRFRSWQLLLTAHDRLWAKLIENRARKVGFSMKTVQFSRWSASDGPRLVAGQLSTALQLSTLMEEASPEILGSYSGRALEELADELSQTLRTSVSRAPGDRYTLGDLWPGLYKVISKSGLPDDTKAAASSINNELDIRNLYSAHYNRWAESFSAKEIYDFAKHIVGLWKGAHCEKCESPLSLVDFRTKSVGWTCGHGDVP